VFNIEMVKLTKRVSKKSFLESVHCSNPELGLYC
jgi:hypothetical protein